MSVPYFTLANIVLGVIGAIFGTFPFVYHKTIDRVSKLEKADRSLTELLETHELTDSKAIRDFVQALKVPGPAITKLKADDGWQQFTLDDKRIFLYDSAGIKKGELNAGEITRRIHDTLDRNRNRTAFGFIALGYTIQIIGLMLGRT